MLKKGNKLYGILTGTCPKCHEESMYLDKNAYHLRKVLKMHERCSHCNTKYKIEPSFFYGAMYVSYGVGIAFAVAAFIISKVLLQSTLLTSFFAIMASQIFLLPIILRLSRNIWISFFITYDSSAKTNRLDNASL